MSKCRLFMSNCKKKAPHYEVLSGNDSYLVLESIMIEVKDLFRESYLQS